MLTEIPTVNITSEPIELCKLLKIANMVSGGGEAKIVISEGYVFLNGEVEFQKRKKVYNQDTVEFNGEIIQVLLVKTSDTKNEKSQTTNKSQNVKRDKSNNQNLKSSEIAFEEKPIDNSAKKSKRKPISF